MNVNRTNRKEYNVSLYMWWTIKIEWKLELKILIKFTSKNYKQINLEI